MLQAPDGVAGGGVDVGRARAGASHAASSPVVVGGAAAGPRLLPRPGGPLPLGPGVAVVAVDGGVGDGPAGLAVGIELGVSRAERLLNVYALRRIWHIKEGHPIYEASE